MVTKGAGFLAARIRQVAAQNGVPIMERKPLVQALCKHVILSYVYELAGKGLRRMARAGVG